MGAAILKSALGQLLKYETPQHLGLLYLARRPLLVLADFQWYANTGQGGVHFWRKRAPLPNFPFEVRRLGEFQAGALGL